MKKCFEKYFAVWIQTEAGLSILQEIQTKNKKKNQNNKNNPSNLWNSPQQGFS